MTTGQVLLTLGAIILLSYTVININRMYVNSVSDEVQIHQDIQAVNYGQSLSEEIYSTAYASLEARYGGKNDINSADHRLQHITSAGEELFAVIDLSEEKPLIHNQPGRIAIISVYRQLDDQFIQQAQFFTALTPM